MSERLLVTFNAGSSTVKIGLFALGESGPKRIGKGVIQSFKNNRVVGNTPDGKATTLPQK